MNKNKIIFITLLILLGGFSILVFSTKGADEKNSTEIKTKNAGETQEEIKEEGSAMEVLQFKADEVDISFEYNSQGKPVSEWASGEDEIIINGAYFLENNEPAGYFVEDKKVVSNRMFDQDKSGLLQIKNGKFSVRDLDTQPIAKEPLDYAIQSYPFLIKNGEAAVKTDSGKVARRTAMGIDKEGKVYVFLVLDRSISLYEFAKEIAELDQEFTYVLNLDGGPSSGVFISEGGEESVQNSFTAVSSIVRIKKKL